MIRIDLAKNELEKTPAIQASILGKLKLPKAFQLNKITFDLAAIFILATAVALACLPQLFFNQYRTYVRTQHQVKITALKQKIAFTESEIAKFTSFKTELESYEQQKKTVSERLAVVRSLLAARGTPVNVLDAIGQSLPRRGWLKNIDFTLIPESASVRLEGKAYSNEEISDYVDKLSESVFLSDVLLEGVSPDTEDKIDLKKFELSAKPKTQFQPTVSEIK